MMLALKSGPQSVAKLGNPAGLLCRRIWYSVGKSGVLGIAEYRQGRPLQKDKLFSNPWHTHLCENWCNEQGVAPQELSVDVVRVPVSRVPTTDTAVKGHAFII